MASISLMKLEQDGNFLSNSNRDSADHAAVASSGFFAVNSTINSPVTLCHQLADDASQDLSFHSQIHSFTNYIVGDNYNGKYD